MAIHERVADILERQHSVATRRQLLAFASVAEFDAHVRSGDLVRVHWTVYRPRGAELTFRGELMAAALRCGPRSRIDGPAVLALLGCADFGPEPPFVVALPRGRRVRNVTFGTWRDPVPDTRLAFAGAIPITSPVRALVHAAVGRFGVSDRELRAAYDWLRWRRVLTTGTFLASLDENPRAPGARRWRRLLDRPDRGLAESEGERLLGDILGAFVPPPEPQVWVLPGVRVDWYFRQLRLAFGYQGSVDHGHREGRAADDRRHRDLEAAGIRWIPIASADLAAPTTLRAQVSDLLTRRAAELDLPAPRLPRGELVRPR